jgi:hypothetical protein
LTGSIFIHRTATLPLKKDAVRVLLLDETDNPTPYDARVLFTEFCFSDTETLSKHGNLFIANAYGAGKSSAAASTPLTFEPKSVVIPKLVSHKMTLPFHQKPSSELKIKQRFIPLAKKPYRYFQQSIEERGFLCITLTPTHLPLDETERYFKQTPTWPINMKIVKFQYIFAVK